MEDDDEGSEEGAPAWMATFADLATLLLTFFVLLLSFANMNVIQFKTALGSVRHALGVITTKPGYFEGRTSNPIQWDAADAPPSATRGMPKEVAKIQAMIQRKQLDSSMKLIVTENHIVLRVNDLFRSGSANLDPEHFEELDVITELVASFNQPVRVEAHTDSGKIASEKYPSNWELSASRAGAVARYLVSQNVDAKRISPGGFAHHRPITTNSTAEGRAKNRRLDIVLSRKMDGAAQVNDSVGW